MSKLPVFILITIAISLLSACQTNNQVNVSELELTHKPIIIAHRGASGFLPEHSKEAAVLAFMQGADYIEQDLVLTRDNQLVVLHDIHLETVTNVEEVFPKRARADNRYYAIDFNLTELRQLSLHERQTENRQLVFPNRYAGTGHFSIATFAEHVELVRELNRQFDKNTGWYPEIKSPQWHVQEGKDIVKVFANELKQLSLNNANAKIYVQSFEPTSLLRLKNDFDLQVPLIQLIADNSWGESDADYTKMLTQDGLRKIAKYAQGIGPWLPQIYDFAKNDIRDLMLMAKQNGLLIHPYTLRADAQDLPDSPKAIFDELKKAGIDGLFTDQVMPYMLKP